MSHFATPEPISVTLELGVGDVRIAANDRTDTVVEVRPSHEADESDVKAAQQVRVDYTNGMLRVTGPKVPAFDFSRKTRSVDVSIELPSGSQVSAQMQIGDFRCAGRLGECRLKTSAGNAWLGRTGPLRLDTSAGHVTADGITGNAEISTGSGRVQIGEVEGTAVVKNSNGDTTIDAVTGDVRVRAANGDISVERAGAGVDAKPSNGSIRLGEVVRGSVVLGTATMSPANRTRCAPRSAMFSLAIVIGVALLVGFRPTAGLGGWLATAGFLMVVTFALVWLSIALGQVSKSVETASNLPMPLVLLPFLGSGFVPTDSMPAGLRWFAEYQPFTPIIETLCGLLMDKPIGNNGWIALAWCAVIALGGYLWSKRLFNRES